MILITGATGNIGNEVVSQLVAARLPARVFVRDSRKATHLAHHVQIATGDFQNVASFARAAEGVHGLFLIASGASEEDFSRLLDAVRSSGAPRVVFVSGSVANWPDSKIGAWFQHREEVVRRSGLQSIILRPCDFMSNTYQWIGTVMDHGVVYNPTGDFRNALIAPEDVGAAAVRCLTSQDFNGQTITLSGGELLSVPEQVNILSEVLNRPIRCVDVSVDTAVENLVRAGIPAASAWYAGEIYERTRLGNAAKLTSDLVKITDRDPKTFHSWVQDHAGKFR